MNHALWNAHLEAVQLRQQIRTLEHRLRDVTRQKPRRCIYCGTPTTRRARACHAHADLPPIDPGYTT